MRVDETRLDRRKRAKVYYNSNKQDQTALAKLNFSPCCSSLIQLSANNNNNSNNRSAHEWELGVVAVWIVDSSNSRPVLAICCGKEEEEEEEGFRLEEEEDIISYNKQTNK